MSGERRILLGRVVGVHGVQGWVKLESHTQPRQNILQYLPWTLRHRGVEHPVAQVHGRMQGQRLLAHWPELEHRDQAETVIGAEIWVPRSSLPSPSPNEYYWVDLESLRVVGAGGFDFGHVSHLFSTGANDVMSVRGERERLIPFIRGDVIKRVDFEAGLIEVDWDPEF